MDVASLTRSLAQFAATPPSNVSNAERIAFLLACEETRLVMESPLEATVRLMFGGFESVALRLAIDMKLIDQGVAAGSEITAETLASGGGADVLLVSRIMRLLVAMKVFAETGPQTYIAKPLARTWALGSPLRDAAIHVSTQLPPVSFLPQYFEEKGYNNPADAFDGPFQYAHKSKEKFFDWLSERPRNQDAFNTTMRIQRMERGEDWFDYYPVEEKFLPHSDIQIVDIGGNIGYDLVKFRKRFPSLTGKLTFEDLPSIIDSASELPEGIDVVGHDFFEPQPTRLSNAQAYYLKNVLHDWPDKQARLNLQNIAPLMSRDSLLLIDENALPDENVGLYAAELDLIMMGVFASLDRTTKQFKELFESAGFQMTGVYRTRDYVTGSGTLFEAKLKDWSSDY
ncbi:S-adenosyl-L-methionine-dependent methyltransferase [Lophiostoma macrostomum CBS 122681]|uniref:S-adenosyl-L-methionine-dependent methyltransferase n=1 Tax=Lophiostoma macrostomum CBS 122681 TaxID=1314788 RepID=A0A6A6SPZ1_9PLEO|nr:S-adenosyl-L-methionine-dependent methyltransferase [Lophiostoma macrostomum CBS 122681]